MKFSMRTNGFFGSYESVNTLLFTESKSFPYFFVNSHNSNNAINLYKKLKVDCFLNAGTQRKLSKDF